MKRERAADDMRRWAIRARLLGMSTREIALSLERNHHTIKRYLCNCGGVMNGSYHLNRLAAKALFTEDELRQLGAVWNGRYWVGPGRGISET
jgi:hypothetical protein